MRHLGGRSCFRRSGRRCGPRPKTAFSEREVFYGGAKVRIGIDVGGTFTDAVVIDNETHEILAKAKVPTTHRAEKGVAAGIILAIHKVLKENQIDPADVVFIAHGTTQATNALLEGDVAKVGIVGMGRGLEGMRAQKRRRWAILRLAPGKFLHTFQTYLDAAKCSDRGYHCRGEQP